MNEITKVFNNLVVRATKDLDSISSPKDRVDSICKLLSTLMDTGALETIHLLELESEPTQEESEEHDAKAEVTKRENDKLKVTEQKKEAKLESKPQPKVKEQVNNPTPVTEEASAQDIMDEFAEIINENFENENFEALG